MEASSHKLRTEVWVCEEVGLSERKRASGRDICPRLSTRIALWAPVESSLELFAEEHSDVALLSRTTKIKRDAQGDRQRELGSPKLRWELERRLEEKDLISYTTHSEPRGVYRFREMYLPLALRGRLDLLLKLDNGSYLNYRFAT